MTPDWFPHIGGLGDDPISMIIGLIALVIFLPVFILLLVVALEFLLLLLLLPFVVLARVLFGHHWVVEARKGSWPGDLWWDAPSGSWSESGQRIDNIAGLIQQGRTPPPTVGD